MTGHQADAAADAGPMTGPPPDADAQSPDRNTARQSYVQVNQATMDMLYTAGVTCPQAINGPGDGEPEYLIPRQIYMKYMYITRPSVPNDTVNEHSCPIDPSLLQANTPPSGKQVPRPKPQRLVGGKRTVDPIARAKEKALIALGMPSATAQVVSAQVAPATAQVAPAMAQVTPATAHVAPATAELATAAADSTQNTLQQITPPSSQSTELPHIPALAMAQVAPATAHVAPATAEPATAAADSTQNTLQQITPPSSQSTELPHIPSASALARRIRRTADDLAQEEAILNQNVGRRRRIKRVKFAGQ
jgi:hypothetical protein